MRKPVRMGAENSIPVVQETQCRGALLCSIKRKSPHSYTLRKNSEKLSEHDQIGGDPIIFEEVVKLRDTA